MYKAQAPPLSKRTKSISEPKTPRLRAFPVSCKFKKRKHVESYSAVVRLVVVFVGVSS